MFYYILTSRRLTLIENPIDELTKWILAIRMDGTYSKSSSKKQKND
jgi:hypothetical protein